MAIVPGPDDGALPRSGRKTRGGGKAQLRDDEHYTDPLLDRDAARRSGGLLLAARGMRLLPRSWWARLALLLAALLLMLAAGSALADGGLQPVPPLQARVTDLAGMLTAQQRAALDGVLADYEAKSGSQIAILLVSSTEPEAIEQYSIRVADAWKLGRKGVDDGVLLLVAKDNPKALRRLRIEAGRGVQGELTDAQSKRVLQDVIAPHFRQGDFYGGLAAGVSAIATLLDKEHFPAPPERAAPAQHDGPSPGWLLLFLFFILPMLRAIGRRGMRRSRWGSDATGVLLGAALGHAASRGWGGGDGGGWSGGSDFGGGGGSFDGGGASGDW